MSGLTTMFDGKAWDYRDRRCPAKTSSKYNKTVRDTFELRPTLDNDAQKGATTWRRNLPIPRMINEYNSFMNGVDIADQLRGSYSTQQTTRRSWMPCWYWQLDLVLTNAFLLCK